MKVAEVNLFGFDWKATPTRYAKLGRIAQRKLPDPHNFAKEKIYCTTLIKTNNWTLHGEAL